MCLALAAGLPRPLAVIRAREGGYGKKRVVNGKEEKAGKGRRGEGPKGRWRGGARNREEGNSPQIHGSAHCLSDVKFNIITVNDGYYLSN